MEIEVKVMKSNSIQEPKTVFISNPFELSRYLFNQIDHEREPVYVISYEGAMHGHVSIENDSVVIYSIFALVNDLFETEFREGEKHAILYMIECDSFEDGYRVAQNIKDYDDICCSDDLYLGENILHDILNSRIKIHYSPN